jgi:hypothetical protein
MWMATMWRSNAVMYVTVPYNEVLFSILYFFNQPIGGGFWNCPRNKTKEIANNAKYKGF